MNLFDLQRAKNLEPLVTRGGKTVVLGAIFVEPIDDIMIVGWVDDEFHGWNENGRFLSDEIISNMDLVMAD